MRTCDVAERVGCAYATAADERPMEGKHHENYSNTTFEGAFGGNNGRFPGLCSMMARSEYLMEYADSNPTTDAANDQRKARRRHELWAIKHQAAIDHSTPMATPKLKAEAPVTPDPVPRHRSSFHALASAFNNISV